MASSTGQRSAARLDAAVWVEAALAAIGRGGIAAVAVEPLAAELGVTKGSFYWHFDSRDALLSAAMDRWEALATHAVIAASEQAASPRARLERLLSIVLRPAPEDEIEAAILGAPDDPIVSPAVRRVTEQRLAHLVSLFRDVGFARPVAVRRSHTAYAAYIGLLRLERQEPTSRSIRSSRTYMDELIEMLCAGGDAGR